MAYLGRQPVIGNFVKLDAISVVNGQAAYTMQNNSVNFTDYATVNQFLVSLNGVIQAPTSSFTVSGSTLTFASNLATGDVIDFIIVFGNSLSAGTPTDATVTSAKLATLTSAMNFQGAASDMRLNFDTTDTVANATPLMAITAKNKTDSVAQLSMRRESAVDDGYIALSTQPTGGAVTERVRIHSGGVMSATQGIALGVGTANTSSNVLDDYEEGTWTGTISDGTNNATMGSNTGGYIKIGSLVVLTGYFTISSLGSVSGNLRLTGLPFACGSSNAFYTSNGLGWGANLSITDDTSIGFQIDTNASHLNFTHWDNTSGTTLLQASQLTASGQFMMNLSYRTDA
jgi:hypothetical protein